MSDLGSAFLATSRRYLRESYLPKVERALAGLSDERVWWRPNDASNSLGNLLLHTTGSLRFWVVSVAGGAPSDRVRDEEFAATGGASLDDLLDGLRDAVQEADAVLARLSGGDLLAAREHDGRSTTVLDAVYHAVEHTAMHTGQVLQLAKILRGGPLSPEG